MSDQNPSSKAEEMSVVTQFLTLGSTMAGSVGAGAGVGVAVDAGLHSSPIGLLVGLGLGIVGAITALVTLIRRWS